MRACVVPLILFSLLTACRSAPPKEPGSAFSPAPLDNWNESMLGLREGLTQLLPVVANPQEFSKPENRSGLSVRVEKLAQIARKVQHSPIVQKSDPSLAFLSKNLVDEFDRAAVALRLGRPDFARFSLLHVTSSCIECHTRTSAGPSFQTESLDKAILAMKPLARAEYFLSVREFDRAQIELDVVIGNSGEGVNYFDVDRAIRYSLAIAVKYEDSPERAAAVLDKISAVPRLPFYLRHNVTSWIESVKEWKAEKGQAKTLDFAEKLIDKGRRAQFGFSDRGGDIYFFRAAGLLHGLVASLEGTDEYGHALYLLGLTYEASRDLAVWQVHENYFEACIRRAPRTQWSEKCYARLRESWEVGYSGSEGLGLPADVKARLDELRGLAFTKPEPEDDPLADIAPAEEPATTSSPAPGPAPAPTAPVPTPDSMPVVPPRAEPPSPPRVVPTEEE